MAEVAGGPAKTASVSPPNKSVPPTRILVLGYRLALERFVDEAVPGSRDAFTMAYNAIRWLILTTPNTRLGGG